MDYRFEQFDILRGSLFIPMFIFHLFSFYDLTNHFGTNYTSIPIIKYLGHVRTIYIILAGYSVYLSYKSTKNKENFVIHEKKSEFVFKIITVMDIFAFELEKFDELLKNNKFNYGYSRTKRE